VRGDGGVLAEVAVGPGNSRSGSSMSRHSVVDKVKGGQWLRAGLQPGGSRLRLSLLEEEVAHEGVGGAQQTAPSGGTQWIGERRWQGDRRRIGGQWMAHMVVAVGRQRRA
jgi:hypothetical protein